jgi:GPH family glycoside/pentoside/hexuronide:cation symporter
MNTTASQPASAPGGVIGSKLSLRTKFGYGLGDWGTSAATAARNLYWLFFLVSVVGLNAAMAGTIILIGRIWDSINDPLVGTLSDGLETRWGRRRPLILAGAIPFGITFFLLFYVPSWDNDVALLVYYAIVYLLFDTVFTVINVPYAAMTPELTEDYDERSSLAGWRIAIAILATLIAASTFKLMAEDLIGAALVESMGLADAVRFGYAVTAAFWSVTLVLSPVLLVVLVKDDSNAKPVREKVRPIQTLREIGGNRPFRLVAVIYMLGFTTADIVVNVFVWYLIYYVRAERGFDSMILGLVLGLAFLTMPLTVKLMRRYGKREAYIGTMTIYAVALFIMSQIPPGGYWLVVAAALFAGLGHGAINVIPWAMVADVVDQGELLTGKRREGIYSGYMVFFRKLAAALAIFTVTRVLAASGFVGGTGGALSEITQPDSALTALRVLVGIVPSIMLVLSILVAWRYPLSKKAHQELLRRLQQQRLETGDDIS